MGRAPGGESMTTAPKATLELLHGGLVARLTMRAPKANILDAAMIGDLDACLRQLDAIADLHAVIITGDGPHFSFGASVEEHLPDRIGHTLGALHALLRRVLEVPAPTIGAIRGQCLGGGLELALACDLLMAEEHADLGCPEIKLGVFPPAASALLPVRIGASRAAALTLTGETIDAREAQAIGLVTRVAAPDDLEAALDGWLAASFLPRSPRGLHFAAIASRREILRAMDQALPAAEHLYLHHLMQHPDAVEGIRAFLEKREPHWHGAHV